jgi:hypothetical protein
MIAVNNYHCQHKGICLIFSIWHLQGVCRYWTPDIKIFLKELSHAESEKETLLKSTLQRMIGRFVSITLSGSSWCLQLLVRMNHF